MVALFSYKRVSLNKLYVSVYISKQVACLLKMIKNAVYVNYNLKH